MRNACRRRSRHSISLCSRVIRRSRATPPRQGHSTGAMIGAGAAGLVGGMLVGEMLDDDDGFF
ncbi:hypothetical protein [Nocardia seriolae]|uniref:3,4-dihydroxy-2-butanone 4-phosphate synthase n=1 Tax=Nocardia seriolae TaxID=37332 RepID=A0ABC9Z4T4_9NOCA|nr:hypothetical protein [Nocardia seriolae]WNJ58267.1 hypothetical protein RMO66_33680 [Nocardia seriolae]BAW04454.1 hypothetical protein NSERUTF1_1225 [Nocardia seriolae]GAM50574.1 3,4-dihydroxy-2-butanone 4-phosphate synthase [Nocardia seriolae]GAP32516.1 3,4-dihydroxy-2-butanone 4-phosphate synthase [Nocardia seriolae]